MIAITGATGQLGRLVLQNLLKTGPKAFREGGFPIPF